MQYEIVELQISKKYSYISDTDLNSPLNANAVQPTISITVANSLSVSEFYLFYVKYWCDRYDDSYSLGIYY